MKSKLFKLLIALTLIIVLSLSRQRKVLPRKKQKDSPKNLMRSTGMAGSIPKT